MSDIKKLIVKLIAKKEADKVVKKHHYSGKVTQNSQLSFGVFLNGVLLGAAQFGPSIDKRRMGKSLGIGMNESLELNRLAISDRLGKNAESRVLGICLKIIKKNYPFIRCIISFADACQCGDGIIYRASNFKLESYKINKSLLRTPSGEVVSDKTFNNDVQKKYKGFEKKECIKLIGFQMKYIYYFDKELEKKHKSIPFKDIPDNIKMYKGKKITLTDE